VTRYRTEDGKGWYHEPPYTEAEEMEFYRRQGNIVGVLKSGQQTHQPTPPQKSPPPLPEE
jgi:hypothetical protein